HKDSGTIRNTQGQTWSGVDMALRVGTRGLPGGSSLARLLARERDVANRSDLPHLRISRILAWADAHRAATGKWPTARSGPVRDAAGEIWYNVGQALRLGLRGLPGDSSLALLLAEHRSVPYKYALP